MATPAGKVFFEARGASMALQFTTNSLCALEEKTGLTTLEVAHELALGKAQSIGVSKKTLRALFWAGDINWPADLAPYRVMFYLQPHVGGAESPITRVRKVYGLSAPRWIARMTFRGGYAGAPRLRDTAGFGPRLDSLIADLQGGLNKAIFHDFRRPMPLQPQARVAALTARAAVKGAAALTVDGFAPGGVAFSLGDYVGGDGRPHIVSAAATIAAGGVVSGAGTIYADASGSAVVGINPPLSADVTAGTVLRWPVPGRFTLNSEDAGQNETEVGAATEYTLDFSEEL